ncbi:MAG: hypothetical protein CM15mP105_0930 [Methanobacteriota archaeon]|nr:MAG: hypothetical protein CM15mP105_0930 [Euryarchaeota archaeon]
MSILSLKVERFPLNLNPKEEYMQHVKGPDFPTGQPSMELMASLTCTLRAREGSTYARNAMF